MNDESSRQTCGLFIYRKLDNCLSDIIYYVIFPSAISSDLDIGCCCFSPIYLLSLLTAGLPLIICPTEG